MRQLGQHEHEIMQISQQLIRHAHVSGKVNHQVQVLIKFIAAFRAD